jgi:cell shape-determining protein MreC
LTEDNDDLKRCYNLQKRELEENSHWVDNQEQLMKASQQLKDENIKMKEQLENLND